jgi:hypothetical protein
MTFSLSLRQSIFFIGLAMISASVVMNGLFARDPVIDVPEPGALALMGLGGAAMMVVSLVRKRKK